MLVRRDNELASCRREPERPHMYPALSIVFFTTASGGGLALLFLIGIGVPLGLLPADRWFGVAGILTAFVLAAGGLVSSVFHLGHPERAWRAFSQWRSSWLSREGVLSVMTFVPAAIFAIGWVLFGATSGFIGLCGVVAAALAARTIYRTRVGYASLKPIHQWHNRWTVPNYLAPSLVTGFLLLDMIVRVSVASPVGTAILTPLAIVAA